MDLESRIKMQNTLYYNRWDDSTIKGAEAIISLELVTAIRIKARTLMKAR